MRSADNELARRVDVVFYIIVKERQYLFVMNGGDDTGHQDIDDIVADNAQHLFIRFQLGGFALIGRLDKVVVLSRNDNRIDTDGVTVIIIFNGYLALGVGAEVGHHLALTTDIRQYLQDTVGKV